MLTGEQRRARASTGERSGAARRRSSALVCARLLPALCIASQLGCYAYVPATLETVPQGAHVRALVTPEAERRLLATFGVQQGSSLVGTLEGRDGDQIGLLIPSVPIGTGPGTRPLYQQVTLASADILRVDVRRVDKVRTGVAVALAVTAIAGYQALKGEGTVVTPPPPPPPAESVRRWAVRIPIPWP